LFITSSTYLPSAGAVCSIIGLIAGAAIMMVIARCYHYMMNCYPDAGGAYTYVKEAFGHDYGFLTAWFLFLTYMAVYWANITSLPLFVRFLIGDIFQFGPHYVIFGYEMYVGEALLSCAAVLVITLLCSIRNKLTEWISIILVVIFSAGIATCFISSVSLHDGYAFNYIPVFIPGKNSFVQTVYIACISTWAFVGFENISNSTAEFKFNRAYSFRILSLAIIIATILYSMIIILSVTAYPPEYNSWYEYICDLSNLSGIKALPAFYATQYYFGSTGLFLLVTALLALILTSIIGNVVAVSRLLHNLAKDDILPQSFTKLSKHGVPLRGIVFIGMISLIIPFLGRTAVSWIIDVTTLGTTLIYALVSASAMRLAKLRDDVAERKNAAKGLAFMLFFAAYLLIPTFFSEGNMATQSYILFTVWSVLGFAVFHEILKRDKKRRFGRSTVVWLSLLVLIVFTSLIWLNQSTLKESGNMIENTKDYFSSSFGGNSSDEKYVVDMLSNHRWTHIYHNTVVVGLFFISLVMLVSNYRVIMKRVAESEEELSNMRNSAYRDPLTGVKSKHAFVEKENEINEAIETSSIDKFSVVVCDVNGLKHINDTYGHKAGDTYICEACKLVCVVFNHSPVFRIGGDEFVVIMSGMDFENRHSLMDTLNKQVEKNIGLEKVVISAGISDFIPDRDKS
ncbi:MAG: amino acid permease, partial [Firmicutes bacterium]|nr:amino acid permease [Bacillota bacterium]